jgi:type IV pilus assembly protein PilA
LIEVDVKKGWRRKMKKFREIRKNDKGFSLVELIVVIAIMVVLIGILGTRILKHVDNSRYGKDMSALDSLHTAMKVYVAEPNSVYPSDSEVVTLKKLLVGDGAKIYDTGNVLAPILEETFHITKSGDTITGCDFNGESKMFKGINWEDIKINVNNGFISIVVPVNSGYSDLYVPYIVGNYAWQDGDKVK